MFLEFCSACCHQNQVKMSLPTDPKWIPARILCITLKDSHLIQYGKSLYKYKSGEFEYLWHSRNLRLCKMKNIEKWYRQAKAFRIFKYF